MDTEVVESGSGQAEKIDENKDMSDIEEERSDKDEASVLSYLGDRDQGSNHPKVDSTSSRSASAQPQVEFPFARGVSLDRTSSISDHERQYHGRIDSHDSVTPTASVVDVDDGRAFLHSPASSRVCHPIVVSCIPFRIQTFFQGTSVAPTGHFGSSMNVEGLLGDIGATVSHRSLPSVSKLIATFYQPTTDRTAVHMDTAIVHGQTSLTVGCRPVLIMPSRSSQRLHRSLLPIAQLPWMRSFIRL